MLMAYVVALTRLGLKPRVALEVPGTKNRIDRIIDLIRSCPYSIHDVSRLDVPRFNVPFELGIAYLQERSGNHVCYVFSQDYRMFQRCLSDLNGLDVAEHGAKPKKLMSLLAHIFVDTHDVPSLSEMKQVLGQIEAQREKILAECEAETLFELDAYRRLVFYAFEIWQELRTARG